MSVRSGMRVGASTTSYVVALDGKGKQLAVGGADGTVRFVNASSAKRDEKKVLENHGAPITALTWDGKGKLDVDEMGPRRLAAFAGICGRALAFAHARSGDAMMIRGYIGDDESFDDVFARFADCYATRTREDHALLVRAIEDGAIQAVCDI